MLNQIVDHVRSRSSYGKSVSSIGRQNRSNDLDFRPKMHAILARYDQLPADGHVVCVDEFGHLNLQPRPGRGWFPHHQPARLPATYSRHGGVRHMFGALD
jgi:hypothetical protein